MSTPFKILFSDKIGKLCFWACLILYGMAIGIVALAYRNLPPYLPLFNKFAWGYARLGNTYEIVIPIILPLGLSCINLFIARFVYEKTPLLARFLFLVNFLLALFTFIFILKLTLIIL